jgi:hypothetical protein
MENEYQRVTVGVTTHTAVISVLSRILMSESELCIENLVSAGLRSRRVTATKQMGAVDRFDIEIILRYTFYRGFVVQFFH